jgi:uroporphyrinogen-III synthase
VTVTELPLMSFAPPLDWAPVDAALADLTRFEAVAFTSPRAAGAFAARAATTDVPLRPDGGPVLWSVGAGTGQALGQPLGAVRRPSQRAVGEKGAAAALAEAMLEAGVTGPVLFPCGDIRRDELAIRLRHEGIVVEEVVCYRSVLAGEEELSADRLAGADVKTPPINPEFI